MNPDGKTGISGRIARAFILSKLTPLLVAAALLLGLFAVLVTPREEEPQIIVPMFDVFVSYPGASAKEVEERVTRPMEKLLLEIKGVEYVYSIARPGGNLTIVRFYVGESIEESLVKVYNKLMSNFDRIPPGVSQPLVKSRSIDDVPILALTLWSPAGHYSGYELRRVADELCCELSKVDNVSELTVIGGQKRQVKIVLNPARLKAYHVSIPRIMGALQSANMVSQSGAFPSGNREYLVDAGAFLKNAGEIGDVVVGSHQGRPVYLRSVARIEDGPEEPANYVFMGLGPARERKGIKTDGAGQFEAVTIAVSKKKGANASIVAGEAIAKTKALRGTLVPTDINATVTRNYGETAKDKSDELLDHMLLATISVIILIALALGWREATVVAVAVPVTLALTLLVNYLYGYTLNRVTLFALIFSIGILVDDAIVVVENIHRRFRSDGAGIDTAVAAVDEVGNPTILATFTVISALLPMAFVSGLMGPYMRPIPVGASAAMLFSLLVAFIVSPWLGYRVLSGARPAAGKDDAGRLHRFYDRLLGPLLDNRKKRWLALGAIMFLLLLAVALVPLKLVQMKMLPFDNKSEFQVIIDTPEGSTLEETAALAREISEHLKGVPEVTDFQIYAGTASPYNFNGLVRHYYLRAGSSMADIQVNLAARGDRQAQSHEIAKRLRPELKAIGDRFAARIKVAEVPPGPPVLSTLVAEIYGPDFHRRTEIAAQIKKIFTETPGVVDVDWYYEDDQKKLVLEADREKAAANGISTADVARSVSAALSGVRAGIVHFEREKAPVEIFLRMPIQDRADRVSLKTLGLPSASGAFVPLAELVTEKETIGDKTIYHKNMKELTYVIGDVAGAEESPAYAILKMQDAINKIRLPEGYGLKQYYAREPWLENTYSLKWDGEMQITHEVFRDLGIAFAAVLVLIYVLVTAWFRDFVTPLIIMAPIPLTLVGIFPGHMLFGAFFTATSMIGFIALSGIIVRNSILLVDFIQLECGEKGDLRSAVIAAGEIRSRPIILTAAAVVVGSFVILFDPIFQGLAISMMFGAVIATALTLVAVPLLYYEFFRGRK
jgi:multidrug efflux pump subunit AcrB